MPGKSPYNSVGDFARFGNDKPLKTQNFGAQGRNRTTDTVIFSHVLYQLSYLGEPWFY